MGRGAVRRTEAHRQVLGFRVRPETLDRVRSEGEKRGLSPGRFAAALVERTFGAPQEGAPKAASPPRPTTGPTLPGRCGHPRERLARLAVGALCLDCGEVVSSGRRRPVRGG